MRQIQEMPPSISDLFACHPCVIVGMTPYTEQTQEHFKKDSRVVGYAA